MRYLALDFETGNASPLSACALGASVFEDNQLVDEKISLIRPPECVGKFHWGNVRVNHIKDRAHHRQGHTGGHPGGPGGH